MKKNPDREKMEIFKKTIFGTDETKMNKLEDLLNTIKGNQINIHSKYLYIWIAIAVVGSDAQSKFDSKIEPPSKVWKWQNGKMAN